MAYKCPRCDDMHGGPCPKQDAEIERLTAERDEARAFREDACEKYNELLKTSVEAFKNTKALVDKLAELVKAPRAEISADTDFAASHKSTDREGK